MFRLARVADLIDRINDIFGRGLAWVALLMVVVQFTVVLMRYAFGTGFVWLQESLIYMHAILFMLGAAYTLLRGGHVRVDIFYRSASARTKAIVDLIGVFVLLLPMCWLIFEVAWPYVVASWNIREGSRETSGIPYLYLLKTTLLVFPVMLGIQGLSLAIRSLLVLRGLETPPPDVHGHI